MSDPTPTSAHAPGRDPGDEAANELRRKRVSWLGQVLTRALRWSLVALVCVFLYDACAGFLAFNARSVQSQARSLAECAASSAEACLDDEWRPPTELLPACPCARTEPHASDVLYLRRAPSPDGDVAVSAGTVYGVEDVWAADTKDGRAVNCVDGATRIDSILLGGNAHFRPSSPACRAALELVRRAPAPTTR